MEIASARCDLARDIEWVGCARVRREPTMSIAIDGEQRRVHDEPSPARHDAGSSLVAAPNSSALWRGGRPRRFGGAAADEDCGGAARSAIAVASA